jgi:topoisomerase IA-like protein
LSANSNHDSLGCTFSRPLWPDAEEAALISDEEEEVAKAAAAGGSSSSVIGSAKLLGQHPDSGKPVWIKRGPFGLYLQLVSWL